MDTLFPAFVWVIGVALGIGITMLWATRKRKPIIDERQSVGIDLDKYDVYLSLKSKEKNSQ